MVNRSNHSLSLMATLTAWMPLSTYKATPVDWFIPEAGEERTL